MIDGRRGDCFSGSGLLSGSRRRMEDRTTVTARQALRVIVVLVAVLTAASPAYAYLDPSTGSMVISAVIGIVAALALAVKMFWYRSIGLLRHTARQLRARHAPDRHR